jgi:hypothetical protein
MTITTRDGFLAAVREKIPYTKTTVRSTISAAWYSLFDVAGEPGAGTLAAGNTANGISPTDQTPGCPPINTFGSGATGYLASVSFSSSVACRLRLVDRLFAAGAFNYNAAQALSGQPSISGRCPDYTGGAAFGAGNQIWIEAVTAFTGNLTIAVTYTNSAGVTGRSTGAFATGVAPAIGRMIQLPLQAGDSGVQTIESVTATASTAGTFNVLILRPLFSGRVQVTNGGDVYGPDKTGMPVVYDISALQLLVSTDSTSSGYPDLLLDILNG